MQKFTVIKSIAVPWLMPNVDTDIITPMKRMLSSPTKLEKYAFEPYRFVGGNADTGKPDSNFPLNQPQYKNARIMIVGENFGGGSSRETAPKAIAGLGILCLIGTSFGGIFFKNCFQVGVLPISLPKETLEKLAMEAARLNAFTVNLEAQQITVSGKESIPFRVEPLRRTALLEGLDDVGMILKQKSKIKDFLVQDRERRPWVY
jgi:3-isopropylmalate/(R)-2-methylmalate dehydratase small subunit